MHPSPTLLRSPTLAVLFAAAAVSARAQDPPVAPAAEATQPTVQAPNAQPQQPAQQPAQPAALPLGRAGAAADAERRFIAIARQTLPSIVTVRGYVRLPGEVPANAPPAMPDPITGWMASEAADYPGFRMVTAGSGFFIDAGGDVLTCNHVLLQPDGSMAELFDVELADGSRVIVEVVGTEPTVNLAVLHTMVFPNGHARAVPPLRWGDSDALQTGQWTLGFGDPAGPEKFLAVGTFITAPKRDCYQAYLSAFYLQASMVAHPEAYGGPLVDLDGAVIGILTPRTPTPAGIAGPRYGVEFALPAKIVAGLYDTLKVARSFRSPWLGFSVMSRAEFAAERGIEAFNALQKPRAGILIEDVFQPSPAAAAGIQPGDFLCGFGDARIFSPVDFQRCLYLAGIGRTVELELFRQGETLKKKLTIELRPAAALPR